MSRQRTETRVRRAAAARLEPDETIVAWTRAWYSRVRRVQRLAARYRDIAVLTDRRLLMFEVGHFTRRPRRRVLADRLDELTVEDVSAARDGSRVRFAKAGHRPMLLELGAGAGVEFGACLLAGAGRRVDSDAAPDPGPPETGAAATDSGRA